MNKSLWCAKMFFADYKVFAIKSAQERKYNIYYIATSILFQAFLCKIKEKNLYISGASDIISISYNGKLCKEIRLWQKNSSLKK